MWECDEQQERSHHPLHLERIFEEARALEQVDVLTARLVDCDLLRSTWDDPKGGPTGKELAHAILGCGDTAAKSKQDVSEDRNLEQDRRLHARHSRVEWKPRRKILGVVLCSSPDRAVQGEATRDEPCNERRNRL